MEQNNFDDEYLNDEHSDYEEYYDNYNIQNPEDITLEEVLKQMTSYELLIAKGANGQLKGKELYSKIDEFDSNSYSYIRYLLISFKSICNEIKRNVDLTKNLKFTKENFEFMKRCMEFFCELDDYKTIMEFDDNKVSSLINTTYELFEKRYNEILRENLIMYSIPFTDDKNNGLEIECDENTISMISEKTFSEVTREINKSYGAECPKKDFKIKQRIEDVQKNEE